MCGWIVVVGGREHSHRMLGRLTRRGPDGIGFFTDGKVTVAHARLEIVGKQDQPESGPSVLAFNGEVYGERYDATFLQATRFNGVNLRHMNGFWAYMHYKDGKVEIGRDQLGIKPIYYCLNPLAREVDGVQLPFVFVAGTTLRSVLEQLPAKPSLNYKALSEWARYQFVFGRHTFFEGIYRVMPGETITYDLYTGEVGHETYEDIWRTSNEAPTEEWYEEGRGLLRRAGVEARTADVPFASTCSGGIDSSLVTRLTDPEHAFHANFSDPECNETFYAQEAVRGTRTRLLVTNAQEDFDLCERLADIVQDFDDLAIGSVILPLDDLMQAVHHRKYKVLLLGTGGDELFGGYVRHAIMGGVCEQDSYRALFERTREILDPAERYEALHAKGNGSVFRFYDDGQARHAFANAYREAGDPITFDRRHFLPGLLTIDDRMSGRWGIEGRPALLHQPLVRHVARLDPTKLTTDGLKSIGRKMFEPYLPASILGRSDKMGFTTPIGTFTTSQAGKIKERLYSSKHRELFNLDQVRWCTENKWDREVFGVGLLEAWLAEYVDT